MVCRRFLGRTGQTEHKTAVLGAGRERVHQEGGPSLEASPGEAQTSPAGSLAASPLSVFPLSSPLSPRLCLSGFPTLRSGLLWGFGFRRPLCAPGRPDPSLVVVRR